MRTTADEHFGGSLFLGDFTNNQQLPHPTGDGGCRHFVCAPTSLKAVVLPPVWFFQLGTIMVVANVGSQNVQVKGGSPSSVIAAVSPGTSRRFVARSRGVVGSSNGTWIAGGSKTRTLGAALAADRQSFDVELRGRVLIDFNLMEHLKSRFGYLRLKPAAVRLSVYDCVMGASSTGTFGFNTGDLWPAGSTLLWSCDPSTQVRGRSGNGGNGGPSGSGFTFGGSGGGPAVRIAVDTWLMNYGSIGGGGGGGGGGHSNGAVGGGGGGSGAGYTEGFPGNGGSGGGQSGQQGNARIPGQGGSGGYSGGAGGALGAAGATGGGSGGVGGNGGDAIRRVSAYTLTKLVAGTISGAEVTI